MAGGGGRQQAGDGTETQYSVRYPRVGMWPLPDLVHPILNDHVSCAVNLLSPQKHTQTYTKVKAYK